MTSGVRTEATNRGVGPQSVPAIVPALQVFCRRPRADAGQTGDSPMSIKSISAIAAAALALSAGVAQANTVNGFANGGFENNDGVSADSWLAGAAGYSLSTDARTGDFAALVTLPDGGLGLDRLEGREVGTKRMRGI